MSLMPFSAIKEAYAGEGIAIHESILSAREHNPSCPGNYYVPTDVLAAIAVAGRILRKEPGTALVDGVLPEAKMPSHDTPSSALSLILNASLEPVEPLEDEELNVFCSNLARIDTCGEAEEAFAITVGAMRGNRSAKRYFDQLLPTGSQVVIGKDGEPIMIRKSFGEPSALTLKRVMINGVPYPPGSLMRLLLRQDIGRTQPEVPKWGTQIVPWSDVWGLAFMRLSMYALEDSERKEIRRTESKGYATTRAVRGGNLTKFIAAAQKVSDSRLRTTRTPRATIGSVRMQST